MSESTPHQIRDRDQQIKELINSITNYIAQSEFKDLIQRSIEEAWTIDQAREHVAFKALLLEWYMDPNEDPNPERYALREIQNCAKKGDYERLDPSLQFHG